LEVSGRVLILYPLRSPAPEYRPEAVILIPAAAVTAVSGTQLCQPPTTAQTRVLPLDGLVHFRSRSGFTEQHRPLVAVRFNEATVTPMTTLRARNDTVRHLTCWRGRTSTSAHSPPSSLTVLRLSGPSPLFSSPHARPQWVIWPECRASTECDRKH